jgi:ABC-type branched-subunit amino acid transport system substrate-binding protein
LNAYTYVVDQFNASQSGVRVELIAEDGKCDGKDATSAAQKLINIDKVQVIVGGFCSAETVAAGKIAQTYRIPMLSPVSSAPEISNIGTYVFKFYDDSYVSRVLAKYLHSLSVEKVVAVVEQSDACVGFVNAFTDNFSGQVSTYFFTSNEKDFSILAKQVKSRITPTDFLLFLGCNDVTTVDGLKAFDREGILELMQGHIASNEIITSNEASLALGTKLNGVKTTQLKNIQYFPEVGKTLGELFKDRFTINTDVLRMVLSAEAMDLTIEAIETVGNNAEAIKDYFTALNSQHQKS